MLSPVMCTTAGFDLGRELASLLSTPVKAIHPVADRPKALRTPFSSHKPRILILYGSLRTVAYSRHGTRGGALAEAFRLRGADLRSG